MRGNPTSTFHLCCIRRPLKWLHVLSVVCIIFQQVSNAYAQAPQKPNITSDRYIINQSFDRQAFFKDNNVWVYTPAFAETFGMPPVNIDVGLRGIEAAAFRVEDTGYQTCGLGGKVENCKDEYRCVTDIYVDEKKYPLPWATEQQADWLPDYNSLRWLRTPSERGVWTTPPPKVIPNRAIGNSFTLHPFSDPETSREVNYFQNGDTPFAEDVRYNFVGIYGYKRAAIAKLTLVSLRYRCLNRNSQKPIVTFRLESREVIFSTPLARFHEFQLPKEFGDKIDQRLEAHHARDRENYKNLLNMK